MQHRDIWTGIDRLAQLHGLSPSALARRAGLDATAFNPSKRVGKDGRLRWPSTESIARTLDAVGSGFDEFAMLVEGRHGMSAPLLGFAQAGHDGFFDAAGFPSGEGWESVQFPGLEMDEPVYALQISGDSMQPAYRPGDRIIVAPNAEIKRRDRVVVKTVAGEVMAKILARRTQRIVELDSLNPDYETRSFKPSQIAWIARILWASQ